MTVVFALLREDGRLEFVTTDGDPADRIRELVPDATPRQVGPVMMWDADDYMPDMRYNPLTEAVIGQGVGYRPGHPWMGPCAVTMAEEHDGAIPTLSPEMRDRITRWAAPVTSPAGERGE